MPHPAVGHPVLRDWLAGRAPAPPERLAASLHALLSSPSPPNATPRPSVPASADADLLAESLVQHAAEVVRRLLASGGTDRQSALELLAADALATYAFEAAADDPGHLEARCCDAMRRLSAVVNGEPGEPGEPGVQGVSGEPGVLDVDVA